MNMYRMDLLFPGVAIKGDEDALHSDLERCQRLRRQVDASLELARVKGLMRITELQLDHRTRKWVETATIQPKGTRHPIAPLGPLDVGVASVLNAMTRDAMPTDEEIEEAAIKPHQPRHMCMQTRMGHACTRSHGHPGIHVTSADGKAIAWWPQGGSDEDNEYKERMARRTRRMPNDDNEA